MDKERTLFYKCLGLSGRDVDQREIIKAYLLGKKNFPGLHDQLDHAFAVLSDSRLKSVYDFEGQPGLCAEWCKRRLRDIRTLLRQAWEQHVATMQAGGPVSLDVACREDECSWVAAKLTMVSTTQQGARQVPCGSHNLSATRTRKRSDDHSKSQKNQILSLQQKSKPQSPDATQDKLNRSGSLTQAELSSPESDMKDQILSSGQLSKQDLPKRKVYKQASSKLKSEPTKTEPQKSNRVRGHNSGSKPNITSGSCSKVTPGPRDKVVIKQLVSWPRNFPSSAWKSNL